MSGFGGTNAFAIGGFDRDAGMVYNNQGGKESKSKSSNPYKKSRSTSKPKYRNKYNAHKKSRRGGKRARKGRSKSSKSILNRTPKGAKGVGPGGTNIARIPPVKPSIAYRAKRITRPRRIPRLKRNSADI